MGQVSNTVELSATTDDPNMDDNSASTITSVIAPASVVNNPQYETSLHLDGTSNSYIGVNHHPDLNLADKDGLTIEAWIRRDTTDSSESILGKGIYRAGYRLGIVDQKLYFYSGESQSFGNTNIPTNVWTHVAVVWERNGQRRHYINGDLDYQGNAGLAPSSDNLLPLLIGSNHFMITNSPSILPSIIPLAQFSGDIAEVRLWNVARNQNDIRRTMHTILDEPRPGLIANWHLTDDMVDSIGHRRGILQGSAELTGQEAPPRPSLVPVDDHFNQLPKTRYAATTAYIPTRDQAMLIGGMQDDLPSNQIDIVDTNTGKTSSFSMLPEALLDATATYVPSNETVYVFGGNSSNNIYTINIVTGTIQALSNTLPISLNKATAVYHTNLDKVYILGGISEDTYRNSIYEFDPENETVSTIAELPSSRANLAAAYSSATKKIYAFGGRNEAGVTTNSIFAIDMDAVGLSGAVKLLTSTLPFPNADFSAVEDPISHLIYLVGGAFDPIFAFDPLTEELWKIPIHLPKPRTKASVIYSPLNRQMVLMGEQNEGQSQNDIWRIPLGDGPAIPLRHWDFPEPAGAKVTDISADGRRIIIGTWGNGAWRYDDSGNRFHYSPGILGSANGIVHDVHTYPNSGVSMIGTNDVGAFVDDLNDKTYFPGQKIYYVGDFADGTLFFGPDNKQGLKRLSTLSSWSYFSGKDIGGMARSSQYNEFWVLASDQLAHLDLGGSPPETYYGQQCNIDHLSDLAFVSNNELWLVGSDLPEKTLAVVMTSTGMDKLTYLMLNGWLIVGQSIINVVRLFILPLNLPYRSRPRFLSSLEVLIWIPHL